MPIEIDSKITLNKVPSDLIERDSNSVIEIELKNVDYKLFTVDYIYFLGAEISETELKDKSLSVIPFITGQTEMLKDNLKTQNENLIATRVYQTNLLYDATWVIIYNNLLIRVCMFGFSNLDFIEKVIKESEFTIFDKTRVKKNSF